MELERATPVGRLFHACSDRMQNAACRWHAAFCVVLVEGAAGLRSALELLQLAGLAIPLLGIG